MLEVGDVVALEGPLGAGKTTLVQGLARGAGYRGAVSSPTFALVNEYRAPKANVYHMDMYRLKSAELRAFPLDDYWGSGICLIEWADRVRERWPDGTLALRLKISSARQRALQALNPSAFWKNRLGALPAAAADR